MVVLMKRYLQLILKKKELINKLQLKLADLHQQAVCLHQTKCLLDNHYTMLAIDLWHLQQYDEENDTLNYMAYISIIVFMVSVFSFSSLASFFSYLSVISAFLGFNALQVLLFFGASKIVKQHYQKKRKQNQEMIYQTLEQMKGLDQKRLKLEQDYQFLQHQRENLQKMIDQKKQDMQMISQAVMGALLRMEQSKPSYFNYPLLDHLIEQQIKQDHPLEIDSDWTR